MKRRKSGAVRVRRNLIVVGGLVSLFFATVILVRLAYTPPLPVTDYDLAIDVARRAAPENAYFLLKEAEALLPALQARESTLQDSALEGRLRVAESLLLRRNWNAGEAGLFSSSGESEDLTPLFSYLESAEPALAKLHEALDKPYFLRPEPIRLNTPRQNSFVRLSLILLARGIMVGELKAAPVNGVVYLLDAIRLSRKLNEDADPGGHYVIESAALDEILKIALLANKASAYTRFQKDLVQLGVPYPDLRSILENKWRAIDATLIDPNLGDPNARPGWRFERRVFAWRLQREAKAIREHKQEFLDMAAGPAPYTKGKQWVEEQGTGRQGLFGTGWGLYATNLMYLWDLAMANEISARYQASILALALEKYQLVHSEFPESLEELVPDFIEAIPQDPVSQTPLLYRREEMGYLLYSPGEDGIDHGALLGADLLLVHRTAEGFAEVSSEGAGLIERSGRRKRLRIEVPPEPAPNTP